MLVLSIPSVQTWSGKKVTDKINHDFGTNILVKKLDFSFLGSVQLKGVEIRDHHKDTLIFVDNLSTSLLNFKSILDNEVDLGAISLNGANLYIKTYKDEKKDNLSLFINSFKTKKDSTATPFVLKTKNIYLDALTFKLIDENAKTPLKFLAKNAGGNLQDFSVIGSDFSTKIRSLYLVDERGLKITNFSSDFSYNKSKMVLEKVDLLTDNKTNIKGNVTLNYKNGNFEKFNDRVLIKANFGKSKLSLKDLNKIYREFRGSDIFNFRGKLDGTLNNFSLNKFNLRSNQGIKIIGDLGFVNALNSDRGFVFDGDLDNVTANYQQLKRILPNVLGKKLPSDFEKLGDFSLSGLIKITPDQMDATLDLNSEIGSIISDLQLTNTDNIDEAEYSGNVEFENFDVGVFANDSILGKVSLIADVNGRGFSKDNINTIIIGRITDLYFNGYNYRNLDVNGQFQNKKFDGLLNTDDENLKMKFEGLADFSSAVNKFDFKVNIAHVDLQKTNLFTRDSISVLKGKIVLDVEGNTFDDIVGEATFEKVNYRNQKKRYPFEKFEIVSSIKDSVKTIKVNSKEIIKGEINGKFKFADLLPMAQNSLGSIYTNYNPYPISSSQFVNFNFTVYNQIVDVFLPEVSIGKKTNIKGRIKSKDNYLKLTFSSPKVEAYGNTIDKLLLRLDNKNPLYNTHITAKSVKTKYYDIAKLNLLNRTQNDTLFFKSVFKGGKAKTEKFNLDFFYTINELSKSVIGIQKSTFDYQNNVWNINPKDNDNNKITFDLKTNTFKFSPFDLVSNEQKIDFAGFLEGKRKKDFKANFANVNLTSFLPQIDSLALKGVVNGVFNYVQKEDSHIPKGKVAINNLYVNDIYQGDLNFNIVGENSLEKYKLNASLENEDSKSFTALGTLDFSTEKPLMDLNISLKEFQLQAFSPLGGTVLSNLRGAVSGDFTAKGAVENPDFDGLLKIKDAGVTFPYLNVDYALKGRDPRIRLKEQAFTFEEVVLEDTKYKTKGSFTGSIAHLNFKQWFLNLDIGTRNLLVLDTEADDEVKYYGTGFLDGLAKIRGLTSNLTIDVTGKTNPGTVFVIPLSDVKTIDNYKLIHFKSDRVVKDYSLEAMKGLNLKFNLQVTKDALAQVVIDEVSGSELKGRGDGDLYIEIDTRGKFIMEGDYVVDSGVYNFRYGKVINKPFVVKKGGTISWNGSPFDAELNIEAIYQTKADPGTLLESVTTTRKIPVDLYTRIFGGLFDSTQDFDIKIPNADPSLVSELDFILNDNDLNTKMQNFTFLIVFGTFYNPETIGSSASSGLTGTASELVSSIFTSIINNKDSKVKIGVGYTSSEKTDVENLLTDDSVDLSLSSQLSDRILVNGNVGVPVGTNSQTSIVGELNVEVLINEQGNFRGTVFNRQNDVNFSQEDEGYTQGVGLSYQVNFNTLSGLLKKIGLKKEKPKNNLRKVAKDSVLSPQKELINFKEKSK